MPLRCMTILSHEKVLRNLIECTPGCDENMTENAQACCDQVTRMGVFDLALQQRRQGTPPGLTFADDNGLLRALPEP
jgi:hypothetical protein